MADEVQAGVYGEGDAEDESECRYCHLPAAPGHPLSYPCRCRGSVKYVHEECVINWLEGQDEQRCEVCLTEYSFGKLYAEEAPETLPWFRTLRPLMLMTLPNAIALLLLLLLWVHACQEPDFACYGPNTWQYVLAAPTLFYAFRTIDELTTIRGWFFFLHKSMVEFVVFNLYVYVFVFLLPPLIGLNTCFIVMSLYIPRVVSFYVGYLFGFDGAALLLFLPVILMKGFEFILKTTICPIILGVWIQCLLVSEFGIGISSVMELLNSQFPLSILIIWIQGSLWVLISLELNEMLLRFLRSGGGLWEHIRRYPETLASLYLGKIIIVYFLHSIVVLISIYLPSKTINLLFPNTFRHFGFTGGYLMLITIESFNWSREIHAAVEPLLYWWISCLKLSHSFLCDISSIVECSMWYAYYDGPRGGNYYRFLGMMFGSLYLVSLSFGAVIMTGDFLLFNLLSYVVEKIGLRFQQCLPVYWMACLILPLRNKVVKWRQILLHFSIWVSVIPALLGGLIGIPWQDRTPTWFQGFPFWLQEWSVGLVSLLCWSLLSLFTDCFQTAAWQTKIEIIKRGGLETLGSVTGSALQTLGLSLLLPYLLSLILGQVVWPAFFFIAAICLISPSLVRFYCHARKTEYDRLYCLGEHRLLNHNG